MWGCLFRWNEVTRRIEMWISIQELNEMGEYTAVELHQAKDVNTGGIFQLRQVHIFSVFLFILKLILNFILSFSLVFFSSLSPSFCLSITCSGSFSQSSGDSETRTTFGNVASHGRSNSFSLYRRCDCQINQTAKGLGQLPGKRVNFSYIGLVWFCCSRASPA